ncbi:MAG: hypothetical protein CR982_05085 [Candidatus Cloacimonadota bacterium]|nr:MAG: hypothetical protein CR982_05085 [Candidatus Cloacimonadota bacterium]PIE80542.1 MAG: hypothetical protein CSA15_01915 [Candidatus Delongbacteria bacterium]
MNRILSVLIIVLFASLSFADKIYVEALSQKAALVMIEKGYKHITGVEYGKLKKGESDYQTLTLYKGVDYSFGFGADQTMKTLKMEIYNENFDLVKSAKINSDEYKIVTLSNVESGPYYVKITAVDADISGSNWFFHYSYK